MIGIGINVNNTSANVPGELQLGASSLLMELGEPVERAALVAQLFAELESLYERLQQKDSACILEYWRSFSATLGRPVRVIQRESLIKGIAIDVTEEGALLVRVEDESLVAVHAGEVEHLRIA